MGNKLSFLRAHPTIHVAIAIAFIYDSMPRQNRTEIVIVLLAHVLIGNAKLSERERDTRGRACGAPARPCFPM